MKTLCTLLFFPTMAWANPVMAWANPAVPAMPAVPGVPWVPKSHDTCNIHKVDFLEPAVGMQSVGLPSEMFPSAIQVTLVDEAGKKLTQGSSAVVADDGTLLTAGHIMAVCLYLAGAYTEKDGISHVDRAKLPDITCHFRLGKSDQIVEAKVLAINDCLSSDANLLKSNCKVDYALVKLKSGVEGVKCLRLSTTPAAEKSPVGTLGYPLQTVRFAQRTGAQDAPGNQLMFSSGTVIAPSPTCDKMVDDPGFWGRRANRDSPGAVLLPNTTYIRYLQDRAQSGDMLQTTVDAVGGSSGGPLFSLTTGEVLGVTTGGARGLNDQFIECKGGTFFSSMRSVVADIKANYPSVAIPRCEKNSLLP
jgi:hypothetical protein